MNKNSQFIYLAVSEQTMSCYENDSILTEYRISTALKGLGEVQGSECTPRGWHQIYSRIGLDAPLNTVFVGRKPTGEIYSSELAMRYPGRDWILTRILQLDGLEIGRNKGANVDSLTRYIYIHGAPSTSPLGLPGSHGCIRMHNNDVIELANWVKIGTKLYIE